MPPCTTIEIVVPESANVGDIVNVAVTITNATCGDPISALPGFCAVNGIGLWQLPVNELFVTLEPEQSAIWEDTFIMPNEDVVVHIESWWENGLVLHKDNEAEVAIPLTSGGVTPPVDVTSLISLMMVLSMMVMIMKQATKLA